MTPRPAPSNPDRDNVKATARNTPLHAYPIKVELHYSSGEHIDADPTVEEARTLAHAILTAIDTHRLSNTSSSRIIPGG